MYQKDTLHYIHNLIVKVEVFCFLFFFNMDLNYYWILVNVSQSSTSSIDGSTVIK